MAEGEKDSQSGSFQIDPEHAEEIFNELFNTMEKTVGPWSTKKIFTGPIEKFNPESPVESIHIVIHNMSKMLGVKTAKKIVLIAMNQLMKKKEEC